MGLQMNVRGRSGAAERQRLLVAVHGVCFPIYGTIKNCRSRRVSGAYPGASGFAHQSARAATAATALRTSVDALSWTDAKAPFESPRMPAFAAPTASAASVDSGAAGAVPGAVGAAAGLTTSLEDEPGIRIGPPHTPMSDERTWCRRASQTREQQTRRVRRRRQRTTTWGSHP